MPHRLIKILFHKTLPVLFPIWLHAPQLDPADHLHLLFVPVFEPDWCTTDLLTLMFPVFTLASGVDYDQD